MPSRTEDQTFQTGNVLLISFSHLIHDIYGGFLAPLLPLLIQKLGFSYTLAGFLTAAQRLPSLINPWLGALADKFRLHYFVIISPAVTAISMSLLGVAPSYGTLIVLLTIMGFSSACYHVPTPVILRKVAGQQVGKGMSFFMFGGELARTVGPLVIVGAVSLWGLEGISRLILPGLLASLFLHLRFRYVKIQQHIPSAARPAGMVETFKDLLPLFLGLAGLTMFMGALRAAMLAFLPSYLTSKGYSVSLAGISLSVLQAGGVVGVLAAGYLSDKFGRKIILLIVAIVSPVLMGFFLISPALFSFPILIILGFFLFSTGPVILALVQETNSDRPAYVNGIYMMINFVVTSLMTVIVGAFSDWFGFENTYRFSIFWFLGAIPCLWLLPGHLTLPAFIPDDSSKQAKNPPATKHER